MLPIINQLDELYKELRQSIEQLYEVFAKYPSNRNMGGSPYFREAIGQWNKLVAAKSLRELSVDDFHIYYFKAMTTWGEVNDFKHFLPRIFELLVELPIDFDEQVTLGKLNYGNYENWPGHEKAAIHRFLLAFWQKLLVEESDRIDAYFNGYFLAIASVYPDFSQLLQRWLAANNPCATRRLADFICRNEKKVLKKQVLPGHENMSQQGNLFLEWLKTPAVLHKLSQTVPSESYPYIDKQLVPIIQQLEQHL